MNDSKDRCCLCCYCRFYCSIFDDMKGLPSRVDGLESRVAALEINSATYMARIDTSLNDLKSNFDLVKLQIIKQGMETRVIYEYPHKEKGSDYKYGKDK